ncbi:MAG TPA: BON domain-containing protein [Candidatus Binataceae bacterium]|nr:BON domain-containing protein [Candidatus Binataceae bacterium]
MKRCPECDRTYPDSERFCATDGVALVSGAEAAGERATQRMVSPQEAAPVPTQAAAVECPVCGGRALPGEEVCSFCGARLTAGGATSSPPLPPPLRPSSALGGYNLGTPGQTQTFDDDRPQAQVSSWRWLSWIGYVLAALIALTAGAWFAWHLNSRATRMAAAPSPSAISSPAVNSGPVAALAAYTQVQVTGESADDPARNSDAAIKVFNQNKAGLLDVYRNALAGDPKAHDGLLVNLTVTPDGSVTAGAIQTSTSPNPALDGDVIKTMMGWHYTPFSGSSVQISYPVVMARNPDERSTVDSALADKIAHMNSGESPEYANAPAVPAPAPSAAAASPAATAGAGVASLGPSAPPVAPEPIAPPVARPPLHRERPPVRHVARPPRPKPTLLARVQERLRADRRFGRVGVYTNGGGVVTLYGKVFDDKAKRLAVKAARGVDGVSDVIDNLHTDTAEWAAEQSLVLQKLQGAGLTKVTVQIIGHDAYLDGEVSSNLERERAVTIAESAAPVTVRTNLIRVVPKGIFGF